MVTDALSSVLISPDLSVLLVHHAFMPVGCYDLFLQTATVLFPTYLYHSVTSDWYSPDKPTDCSSLIPSSLIPSILNSLLATTAWYSYDIIPVSGRKVQQAVTGLWRFCVCNYLSYPLWSDGNRTLSFHFSGLWLAPKTFYCYLNMYDSNISTAH